MTPADREAVRVKTLELLRATRAVLLNRPRASLDDLIFTTRSCEERRAEAAAFIVISQVFVAHGLGWTELFTPADEIGVERLREILMDAMDLIRSA